MTTETITAEKFYIACGGDLRQALERLAQAREIFAIQKQGKKAEKVADMICYLRRKYAD